MGAWLEGDNETHPFLSPQPPRGEGSSFAMCSHHDGLCHHCPKATGPSDRGLNSETVIQETFPL